MKFNLKIEEINYAMISYKDNEESFCTVKAEIKKIDSKFLLANVKFQADLSIEIPQEIFLNFICNDGIYYAKTSLLSLKNDAPYTIFYIKTPEIVEHQQKREFFRVKAQYDCVYSIKNNGVISEYKTQTADISAGGVSIILATEEQAQKITEITLRINNTPITARVTYVRSTPVADTMKASFKFDKISETNREFITQACFQKQMEERRKILKLT